MENVIGLRLIHSHFVLEPNQAMNETTQALALVTSVTNLTDMKNSKPASWIFAASGRVMPFEFSDNPVVLETSEKLEHNCVFFDAAKDMILYYKLQDLISLAILNRSDFTFENVDQALLEESYEEGQKSVVHHVQRQDVHEDAIQTSWIFTKDVKGPKQLLCLGVSYCAPQPHGFHGKASLHHRS